MTVTAQQLIKRPGQAKTTRKKLTEAQREEKRKRARRLAIVQSVEGYKRLKKIRYLSQTTFTDQQLQVFREELERQKSLLSRERESLSKEFSTELCFELERGRSSNHHADINVEESIVTQSLVCNRQKRLGKIDEALNRIDNGTYGICLECIQPISEGRLISTPHRRPLRTMQRGKRRPTAKR